ncbi:MAG: hypothetical protein OXC53_07095 [Rhodobacteraceae bacterium]|nr:hypothetical protein [Paracoccaceae bacterium]
MARLPARLATADPAAGPLAHGREPVLDVLGRDGVHGQMTEGGKDVLADDAGVGLQGPGLPVPGLPVEELLREGIHRMSRRPGAAAVLHRFGEGGNQPAGFGARLGDRHGLGIAHGGVAPTPKQRGLQREAARAARRRGTGRAVSPCNQATFRPNKGWRALAGFAPSVRQG